MSAPTWQRATLADGALEQRVRSDGAPMSFAAVFARLEADAAFARSLAAELAAAPFDAFFWELPCLSRATLERPYAHVLVDAPRLASARVDERAFEAHFTDEPVASFDNLGGDAHLIAPCPAPGVEVGTYAHLASFVRGAPAEHVTALLIAIARALDAHLERPRWVSTSGLGVAWLHVRLDTRPKYYVHAPYRAAD